jgi:hypothetical protein
MINKNDVYLPTLNSISTMKNVYFLASTLFVGASVFGQTTKPTKVLDGDFTPMKSEQSVKIAGSSFEMKAAGDVLFSEQFNGNLGQFTRTAGTMDTIWKFDLDGPNGQFSSVAQKITSTTASNGFAIFDADASHTSNFTDRVGALTSPVIDMTGKANAIISFQHTYRTCCSNAFFPKVEVSTDDFATFQTFDATVLGISVNATSPTTTQKVNISNFLDTASNLNNFKFRFFFDGNGGTSHYFWQIDDITVFENWDYDLSMIKPDFYSGVEQVPYFNIPLSQVTPITFTSIASNDGAQTSNSSIVTVGLSNGGGNVASTGLTLLSGELDTLETATFTPATVIQPYTASYTLSGANADQLPTDNSASLTFNVTKNVYSVDNGVTSGTITNFASNSGQPFKIGNTMEVFGEMIVNKMQITVSNAATNVGQLISGEIQLYNPANQTFEYLTESEEVTITSTNNNSTITLNLIQPVTVTPGSVLLVLARHNGGSTDPGFRSAQKVRQGIVLGYDASGALASLLNPNAVRVRLMEDADAGIAENNGSITIGNLFPNPASESTQLNYNLNSASDVVVTITDLTGKVISTETLVNQTVGGHTMSISTKDFNSGMYYVSVSTGDSTSTKKLIKK